ncbi:MAG TPA: hypothetical protein VM120_21905, partial [Bryobacteraceae bacterium]|nr:hypothetical protein [Bryobacteraceae bacterium]
MFPPEWVPRIEAQRDGSPGSKVFHRITVLFLIKQALMICPAGGIDVGPEHVYKVSSCFLLANDLVLGYEPLPTDTLDQLMAGLMPFYELTPQQAFPEDLIRTLILWEEILPRFRSDARFIDLPALFQERVKISFQQFCQLSLGTTIKPLLAEQQGDLLTDNFFLSPTYFSQTVVPSGEVQRFLELVST